MATPTPRDRISAAGMTRAEALSKGAIIVSMYDRTSSNPADKGYTPLVKSGWIPVTEYGRQYSQQQAKNFKPDNYAAYGAARNVGKPAYEKLISSGWDPVTPDSKVLKQRFGDAPPPSAQSRFETQVQALKVAGGIGGYEAAKLVRDANARGEVINTDPATLSRFRAERIQSGFETQVQAVKVAGGLSGSEAAKIVRNANAKGQYINTDSALLKQLRTQRIAESKASKQASSKSAKDTFLMGMFGSTPGAGDVVSQPVADTSFKKANTFWGRVKQVPSRFKYELEESSRQTAKVKDIPALRFTIGGKERRVSAKYAPIVATAVSPLLMVGSAGVFTKSGKAVVSSGKAVVSQATRLIPPRYSAVERLLSTTARSIGFGIAAVETGRGIARITAPKVQKEVGKTSGFKAAQWAAAGERDIALKELPWWKQFAAEIIPEPIYHPAERQYNKALESEFAGIGLGPRQIESSIKLTKRERKGASAGEVISLFNIGASSETLGRALIGRQFAKETGKTILKKKAGREVVKRALAPLFISGVQEGVATEIVLSRSRQRDISVKSLAVAGVSGGVSASVIGGTIAALAPNFPKASKLVEIGSYITDPYEYGGDLLADVTEGGLTRFGIAIAPNPILTVQPKKQGRPKTFVIGTTQEPGFRMSGIFGVGVGVKPGAQVKPTARTKTNVGIKTTSRVPVINFLDDLSIKSRPRIPPPNDIGIGPPVPPPVPSPVDPTPIIPSPIEIIPTAVTPPNTIINQTTNVPTNIFPNIQLSLPVGSPLFSIPPPIPLTIPGGASRKLGNDASKFINELDLAIGYRPRPQQKRQIPKKRQGQGLFGSSSLFTKLYGIGPKKKQRRKRK